MQFSWLYSLPLWLTGALLLLLFLAAIETGRRSGMRAHRAGGRSAASASGDVTVTALLTLLGLLLAFTYAFSLGRYDQRKEAVVAEINAIGTAFHRAELLPEPGRTRLRRKLLDYARTRQFTVRMLSTRRRTAKALESTLAAQAELWPSLMQALADDLDAPLAVAIVVSINTVMDVHTQRAVAGFDNIPEVVVLLLVAVAALSLGVAMHNVTAQGAQSRWRMVAFAIVLTALILVIMDFDMPLRGLIRPSTAGMSSLIETMEGMLAR